MAEALLNRESAGRFRAFSAGSFPKGEVHPMAVELLGGLGFPTGELRSKSWDEFASADAPPLDFIFTVCDNAAEEVCPVWPGHPVSAHWGDRGPGGGRRRGSARGVHQGVRLSAQSLFLALPIEGIDRMSLQNRLAEIGGMADASHG